MAPAYKGDRLFLVNEEEVRRMGKSPEVLIKAPLIGVSRRCRIHVMSGRTNMVTSQVWDNQYLAANQGQHDIHCLNKLRMWIYAEHYYGNRDPVREIHALHCLHTLLTDVSVPIQH